MQYHLALLLFRVPDLASIQSIWYYKPWITVEKRVRQCASFWYVRSAMCVAVECCYCFAALVPAESTGCLVTLRSAHGVMRKGHTEAQGS